MKMNGSAADAYAAHPPGITVPKALTLPVAAIGATRIGRAVIAIARSVVIAGSVIIGVRRDRAADNGAAKQSGGDADAEAALRMGRSRRSHGRDGQGCDGSQCHQSSLHGVTFLTEPDSEDAFCPGKSSTFRLNDQ